MSLAELRLEQLRCLPRAQLTLHPRLNLITGNNGSGKTSILEAIYLLGRGPCSRPRHTEHLVRNTAAELQVVGRVESPATISHSIRVVCNRQDGVQVGIDGHEVLSRAELSE